MHFKHAAYCILIISQKDIWKIKKHSITGNTLECLTLKWLTMTNAGKYLEQ